MAVTLAVLGGGAGFASVKGYLPKLPYDADQVIKETTLALAARAGINLGEAGKSAPFNPAVGDTGNRPPGAGPQDAAARQGGGSQGARPGGPPGPGGQSGGPPPVTVTVGKAVRADVPMRVDAIGQVQPLASVVVRSRVDSQITKVEIEDGSVVTAGKVLFRLDSRQIEAQIRQAEANLARNKAQLDLAQLDVQRKEQLARNESTSRALLDTARANVAMMRAQIQSDEAVVENLRVVRSYYDVVAPISGRIGVVSLKTGAMARQGDGAPSLTTINQMSPIYVSFPLPQRLLSELQLAVRDGRALVQATPQGLDKSEEGRIAVLDNTIDASTGTIMVRATFENKSELLWPGALVNVRIILRTDQNVVTVPKEAVQTGQNGQFVYVIENGQARLRPVTPGRTVDAVTIIDKGLEGNETVVTDGHLRLVNGARVIIPGQRPPGGGPPGGAPPGGGQRPPPPTAQPGGPAPGAAPPAGGPGPSAAPTAQPAAPIPGATPAATPAPHQGRAG